MISQAVRDSNWSEVNRLGKQVSLHQFLVSTLILLLIWVNLTALFDVIPHGDEYVGGMGVVLFLGMAKIVNSSLSIGTDILNFSKYYPLSLLFIVVLTASAILFNQWLIPLWGINGSACATLFSYLLYFTCLLFFLRKKLKVGLFCGKHLVVGLIIIALFAIGTVWDMTLLPLIAHIKATPIVVTLLNAFIKTVFLFGIILVILKKAHISKDIDALIEKVKVKGK